MPRRWSENPRAVVDFISQFPCWEHWAIWLAEFAKPSLSGANFILVKSGHNCPYFTEKKQTVYAEEWELRPQTEGLPTEWGEWRRVFAIGDPGRLVFPSNLAG